MEKQATSISEKLEDFGVMIICLCKKMNGDYIDKHIAMQLMRSATSIGANYEEGRVAESRNDFIHKLHISLKESREAMYWLKVALKSGLISTIDGDRVCEKAETIAKILSKSIITAKQRKS